MGKKKNTKQSGVGENEKMELMMELMMEENKILKKQVKQLEKLMNMFKEKLELEDDNEDEENQVEVEAEVEKDESEGEEEVAVIEEKDDDHVSVASRNLTTPVYYERPQAPHLKCIRAFLTDDCSGIGKIFFRLFTLF